MQMICGESLGEQDINIVLKYIHRQYKEWDWTVQI